VIAENIEAWNEIDANLKSNCFTLGIAFFVAVQCSCYTYVFTTITMDILAYVNDKSRDKFFQLHFPIHLE
jgi:uncharacterized membrane protein